MASRWAAEQMWAAPTSARPMSTWPRSTTVLDHGDLLVET